MTSPTFCDFSLYGPGGTPCSGAAFELREAARQSESVVIGDWEVEVRAGADVVITSGGTQDSYDEAIRSGLVVAQEGLDLLSISGSNHLLTKSFDDEHLAWWTDAMGEAIRLVSTSPMRFDVPPVKAVVRDIEGNVREPPTVPPLEWHESYRYFRLSQSTDDLFDSYRNAYLALESILSAIAPQVSEGEGAWFRRALTVAVGMIDWTPFLPSTTQDPVEYLYRELYVEMRSAMSHAKSGRSILLPQSASERDAIIESLERLTQIYLALAKVTLGARYLGGGLFASGFRLGALPIMDQMSVFVSDDETPFASDDTSPNPAGGTMIEMVATGDSDATTPFLVSRTWTAQPSELQQLPFVRRAVGVVGDNPMMASVLSGRLTTASARLEVSLGIRGSNARRPRKRFSF